MDITASDGDDLIVQDPATKYEGHNYLGLKGNDHFKLYTGAALGGPGNDTIEKLFTSESWLQLQAAYWNSPAGVVVDLEGGWAEDGWGTRDTLIGVQTVGGSWQGDRLYGDAADNTFYTGGGQNVVDGRAGIDVVFIPRFIDGLSMADLNIDVAIDGLSATITWSGRPEFKTQVSNVERIAIDWPYLFELADFIKPADLATRGLIAADQNRWNAGAALGSATELTYSFNALAPGVAGFRPFNAAEQAAVRAILESAAAVTGLTLRETSDLTEPGMLRFGASQQTATKGTAAMPGEAGAGQVWIDIDSLRDIAPGSEGYGVLLHETGHALGLRHPRNTEAGDQYAQQFRLQDDHTGATVMSLIASPDGLFPSTWGALDITALRHLYGSRSSHAGNDTYALTGIRFSSETSIVDDGGMDTIDASAALAGATIDLVPGHLSSVGVTPAGVGAEANLGIEARSWIENAVGTAFDDVMRGNTLNNVLRGGKGNDWIDGAAGSDTAQFDGLRSDYMVSTGFGKVFLTARDGSSGFDTLLGIETLQFRDQTIALAATALGADAQITVDQNGSISGSLPAKSDSSAGAVSYALVAAPANGSVTISASGAFTYSPAKDFASGDSFSFRLTEGNASNLYTGFVDVRPSQQRQLGGSGSDIMQGTSGHDIIEAGAGNDVLRGGVGNDSIHGGAGLDTAIYAGLRADFSVSGANSVLKPGIDGTDSLVQVERLQFEDRSVALDIAGTGGKAYRIYQAAFDRKPDLAGLGYWMFNMDQGMSLDQVAAGFTQSAEFKSLYGANPTASQFVTKLYFNVLHRAPEPAGFDYWVKAVEAGIPRAAVLATFSESPENQTQLIGVMQAGGMEYLPFG